MKITTDSDGNRPEHVYNIHRLLKSAEELDPVYEQHAGRYGDLKKMLAADLDTLVSPMREIRDQITEQDVEQVLQAGAKKAKAISTNTIQNVRKAVGVA